MTSPDYHADPVTAWAEDVAAGRIVAGPHVRNAAARHLRDLVEGPGRGLHWDVAAAKKAIGFFPRQLRLNGGQFEGRPFELHPSQAFRVGSLFGWKRAATSLRRFRRFYDEEGKGNGKSPFLAGIGLYLLVADGEARAEVYAAAAKKDQAMVLFRDAVAMRDQSPELSSRISVQGENPVWQLTYVGKAGDRRFFKPISNEKSQSGPRPHGALCDEVHEHPNRDTIDMLERGFKFRKQPLLAMATNSGTDLKSICYEEHVHAVNVAGGFIEDDTTFAFVCSLDEGDDWESDPSCWVKANPLLDVTVTRDYLAGVVEQARMMPGKRNGIARLHFCEWTQSANAAISRQVWASCQATGDRAFDPDELTRAGVRCFGGLDLSRARDLVAFTLTWLLDATPDMWRFAAKTWFWTPRDTLLDRSRTDKAPYSLWVDQRHMEAIPGQRVAYGWVASALAEIHARHHPEQIGCDQYGLERLQEHLDDIGVTLPCIVHPQGFQKRKIGERDEDEVTGAGAISLWMPDSILKLEAALLEQRIAVEPNPVMTMCASGTVYAENRIGHRMFDKAKATTRIDGMVSLAMSVGVATAQDAEGTSVYRERRLLLA
jgi:phage terminase large subunit-like protein